MLPHRLLLYGVVVSGNSGHINLKGGRVQAYAVPRGCPVSEKEILSQRNWPGRGCCEEHEFQEPGPVRANMEPLTRLCSSSSLILHSVCASRLTGGMHICAGPRGQLVCQCIRADAYPRLGCRTPWQWVVSGDCKQVHLSSSEPSPNQLNCLGMESPLAWKCCSRQLVGCPIEHSWDVDGTKGPQMLLTQRRRWQASCDMRRERKLPCG